MRLWRFNDLKKAGIVNNHPTLKRLIDVGGFPAGRWLGPNTHVWTDEEVSEWLVSRPANRPVRGKADAADEIGRE